MPLFLLVPHSVEDRSGLLAALAPSFTHLDCLEARDGTQDRWGGGGAVRGRREGYHLWVVESVAMDSDLILILSGNDWEGGIPCILHICCVRNPMC